MENLGLRLWRSQDNETLATPDNESTRQLVLRQPLVVLWSCRLVVCEAIAKPTFYTFYTLSTQNITTLLHYILQTTDYGFAGQKTNVVRQKEGGSRNYGFMDLRKLSFAWLRQTTRQRVNETTSNAAATCSLVVL